MNQQPIGATANTPCTILRFCPRNFFTKQNSLMRLKSSDSRNGMLFHLERLFGKSIGRHFLFLQVLFVSTALSHVVSNVLYSAQNDWCSKIVTLLPF